MAALSPTDLMEPVIASSNRYADIEPYVKGLFADAPQRWSQILPWHFPDKGTKEQEQEFLRRFFTEREIRKQGGADDPGNGFRFLKQVWYTAAKWNLEYRLPAIVNLWFQSNQELLKDPKMKQHILNEDVLPSTFFAADEIKLYGDELLVWAVKIIQFHLRPQSDTSAPDNNTGGDKVTQTPSQHSTQSTKLESQEPAANAAVANQAPDAATQTVPIVPPPSVSSEPGPNAHVSTAHGQTFAGRNFSGDSQPPRDSAQSHRKMRGSYGNKRSSFNQIRARPSNTFGDHRHASNPLYSPYSAPQAPYSPMPPASAPLTNRVPSGGPYPNPIGPMPMTVLPQGQQFQGPPHPSHPFQPSMQQPYGQHMGPIQPQQQMFMQAGAPGPMPHAGTPGAYMHPQPFIDRSNVHPDSRHFSGSGQSMHSMDDKPDYRGKRRDSVQSRGGRGRGAYGGSMRGRGSRGRNSFGAEGQFNNRPAHNEMVTSSIPQRDRGFSIQREKNWRNPEWHPHMQVENALPQDARHTIPGYGFPRDTQMSRPSNFGPNPNGPPVGAPMSIRNMPGKFGQHMARPEAQPCTAGCTRDIISGSCQSTPKLIVFNVPQGIDMNEVNQYFGQFGNIKTLTEPRPSRQGNLPSSIPPKHYIWVAFTDMESTRKCLANKGSQWPGGSLVLEVAREHWDLEFVPFRQRTMGTAGPQFPAFQPPQATQEFSARPMPHQEHGAGQGDLSFIYGVPYAPNAITTDPPNPLVPRDATPTASGVSTPKKGKNNKSKKKKRAGSSETTTPSGMKDSGFGDNPVTSGEGDTPKSPGNLSSAGKGNKAHEAEADDSPDVESSPGLTVEAQAKVEDEVTPEATEGDTSTSTAHSTDPVATIEEETVPIKSDCEDATTGPPEQVNRPDEDINDDSFHTASGSPEAEAVEDEAVKLGVPMETEREAQEDETNASANDSACTNESDSVVSKTPTKSPSPSQSMKKAPVPHISSQRKAQVDVPAVHTEKAKAVGNDLSDTLQVTEQLSVSGNSEPARPAIVTGSNTPAIPEPIPELRSKKTPKSKGPEQTESFSIFAKPKEKRKASKAKKSAGKRKVSSFQMTEISENNGQIKEAVQTGTQAEVNEEQSKGQSSKSQAQQDCTDASISVRDAIGRDETIRSHAETKSKAPAETRAAGADITHNEDDKKQSLPDSQVASPAHLDIDVQSARSETGTNEERVQDEDIIGLGISNDTAVGGSSADAEAEAAKKIERTRKKNKARVVKKRKNKAMAEVTEMSHPGIDFRASTPNFEYRGNDVDSETSLHTLASNDSRHGSPLRFLAAQEANIDDSDSANRNGSGQVVVLTEVDGESIFDDIASKRTKIEEEPTEADSPEVASSKQKMAKLEHEERLKREAMKGKGKAKETASQ